MTSSVLAQNTAAPMPAEVEQAFREVVNNAASFESRSKYATLLVRAGNFEGGIAALEGLLVSPDAPASIRVELGVLSFRLGSYAILGKLSSRRARRSQAGAEPKSQAETLLHDVVQRNKASRLSGRLMIGLRTQSNPTSATAIHKSISGCTRCTGQRRRAQS